MIRVRFAPSPTGHLHLGNVRTALFNYLYARNRRGKFILRIEDTDRERSRPDYEKSLVDDLTWLGIRWDEGPGAEGEYGPYQQSKRFKIYQHYADVLLRKGKAYYCYVTEEEIKEMREKARAEGKRSHFDNRGRFFSEKEKERRKTEGIRPTVRFMIKEPQLIMHDIIRGVVKINLQEMIGDFVILKADGTPTFHLAVCVDDGLMRITHVIRGEDHLPNTPRHILLMEAMGLVPPQYGHLSLIHGPGGEPLSKRLDSLSVRAFRERGYLPEALVNYISLLGWSAGDDREIFRVPELVEAFSLERVGKSASCFDPKKLDWVNGEHLRMLSSEDFGRRALDYLKKFKPLPYDENLLVRAIPILQEKIERFEQLPDLLSFLAPDFPYEGEDLLRRDETREVLEAALSVLPGLTVAAPELLYESFVESIKTKVAAKGKSLFLPLRLALTGREHGPELKRVFPLLGLDSIKERFERALAFAASKS